VRSLEDEVVQRPIEGVYVEERNTGLEPEKTRKLDQTLFNLMPDPIVIVDRKGRFLAINDKVEERTGFKRGQLLGRNFLRTKIVTAKSKVILIKNLAKRMAGMHPPPYEVDALTKDGQKIPVEVNAVKIEYEGKPADLLILRDTTERKAAERALKESEEKFRNLAEQSPSMIFINKKGKVVYANRKCEEIMGYRKEEFYSPDFNFLVLVAPEFVGMINSSFSNHMKGKEVAPVKYALVTKEGKRIEAVLATKLIRYEGENAILGIITDITELKRMKELYRNVFELAPDSIVTVDTEGAITSCNATAVRMLGYSEGEMVGKHFSKTGIIGKRDLPRYLKLFSSVLLGRVVKPLELAFHRKDGTRLLAEVRVGLLKEGGKTVGIQAISRDVTERKKAEEALQESERRFRDISENALEWIWEVDTNWRYTYTSPVVEKILGYKPEEMLEKHFYDLFHPEDREELKKAAFEVFTKKQPFREFTNRNVHKNGKPVWLSTSAVPIINGKGKLLGYRGVDTDVTARKLAEQEVRESQQKFERLFMNNPEAADYLDPDFHVLNVNSRFEQLFGYSLDEIKGKHINSIVVPKDKMNDAETLDKKAEKGYAHHETLRRRKDGSLISVSISAAPIIVDGKLIGTVGLYKDITERKQMEEKLEKYSENLEELVKKRTKELREAQDRLVKTERLAAIGELATMVGHDLRNPLQSIENATYYLSSEMSRLFPSTPKPQKTIEMIQVLRDSVNYADKIIRDLQDFSATRKPMLKKTDINATVKETLSQIKAPENVRLITELGHLPYIEADKDQKKRAFLNLALNGVQAMENGGRLKVSTKKTKGFVEISFEDTGTGMPKENMEKIFTPFFTTRAKGMGMGLPICKKFVDAHRGRIEVESEVGKGSTFKVKLPVQ